MWTLLVLMGAAAAAADVWETKPFTEWSDSELKHFIDDSPWTGKATLTHAVPGGGARPIDDTATVTWTSALPVRQASVREAIGQNGKVTPEMEAALAQPQPFYTMTMRVKGASAMATVAIAPVAMETFLRREGKPPIPVGRAESHLVDKNGKVIQQPPRGGRGGFGNATALISFAFPKTDPITLDDEEVEFVSKVGAYNVRKKFKLKDMVVKGELAL